MTKKQFEIQIFNWIKNNETRNLIETKGNMIHVAFHHLVRWYPQISNDGFDTYSLDCVEKLTNWEITERGIKAFKDKMVEIKKPYTISAFNKILRETTHPEHNISVMLKKRELLNLVNPNLDDIEKCLNNKYKVILISKEEKNILNGNKNKLYMLDGQYQNGRGLNINGSYSERLNSIDAKINNEKRHVLIDNICSLIKQQS